MERAEGLEPQVSPRQRWLPAVTPAGRRGKGPAHRLCCGNPGYLVSGCHRNFARRLETGRNRPFESVGELTLRDSNSGLEIVFHAEPVVFSRVKDTRTPPPDGLKGLFTEIDRDPQ